MKSGLSLNKADTESHTLGAAKASEKVKTLRSVKLSWAASAWNNMFSALSEQSDFVSDEAMAHQQMFRLYKIAFVQTVIILVLIGVFSFVAPLFQQRYLYLSETPEHEVGKLVPLLMPNLTNSAIKAWAASSVTEILTIGFGDFNSKLLAQKERFTADGWSDFVHAFLDKKVGESFRHSQLVLTTVPSEDPIIVSQGASVEHVYQWVVRIPVIMTYATNNEVTKPERSTVTLTLVRVPYEEVTRGVAIDAWQQ